MAFYWAFQLGPVARRNLYLPRIRETEHYTELTMAIELFRYQIHDRIKKWEELPM